MSLLQFLCKDKKWYRVKLLTNLNIFHPLTLKVRNNKFKIYNGFGQGYSPEQNEKSEVAQSF